MMKKSKSRGFTVQGNLPNTPFFPSQLKSGHAYEYLGNESESPLSSNDSDDWSSVTIEGSGNSVRIGRISIDGVVCNVFRTTQGIFAQHITSGDVSGFGLR